jgi:hypothetical protein
MENSRVNGTLKVHGTLTCVSTQKLLCRFGLRRGAFPTPSRSRLGCERDRPREVNMHAERKPFQVACIFVFSFASLRLCVRRGVLATTDSALPTDCRPAAQRRPPDWLSRALPGHSPPNLFAAEDRCWLLSADTLISADRHYPHTVGWPFSLVCGCFQHSYAAA